MYTDLPVLKVLTRAVVENIEDCNGQKAINYQQKLKDLFRRVVAAKPSFVDAWRLYAKVVVVFGEGNFNSYYYHYRRLYNVIQAKRI